MADFIEDAGLAGGSTGWRLTWGHMPDDGVQHRVVCLYATGGFRPDAKIDLDYPGFQVRVRGSLNNHDEAHAKLSAIQRAIHPHGGESPFPATIGGTDYRHVESDQSEPIPLGKDERGRFHFTLNFTVWRSR